MKPRTKGCFGMIAHPVVVGETWLEGEEMNNDYGQFRRRGIVRHIATNELVRVQADIPDTYFTIPATTVTEHGYVTSDIRGLVFKPHVPQNGTPAAFRKRIKKAYR